jgi:hypothetical protein
VPAPVRLTVNGRPVTRLFIELPVSATLPVPPQSAESKRWGACTEKQIDLHDGDGEPSRPHMLAQSSVNYDTDTKTVCITYPQSTMVTQVVIGAGCVVAWQ